METKNEIISLRDEIRQLLATKFPSGSDTKIHWRQVQAFYAENKLFKETTLRRYLGVIDNEKYPNPIKYKNKDILIEIKSVINGSYRKLNKPISISSSNTTNFQGFYLVLSPSTVLKNLNLFPLEILPNGDFHLRYIHSGDIIKGITSFNASNISLYANEKYNEITKSELPFCLHSVFNVQESNSRNDLQPFNLGVATRRKRNTAGLKAVMEILIKIEKPLYDTFDLTALTLEKDGDNFFLLKGTKEYLDKDASIRILQSKIEVDATAEKGKIIVHEKSLSDVVNAFYDLLITEENNAIHLDEKRFKQIAKIGEDLKK